MNLGYFQTVLAPGRWYRQNEFLPAKSKANIDVPSRLEKWIHISHQKKYSMALYDLVKIGVVERRPFSERAYEYRLTTDGLLAYNGMK